MAEHVEVGPGPVSRAQVLAVVRDGATVGLTGAAVEALTAARGFIDELAADAEPHYGVSTGFGALATTFIPAGRRVALQRSLVRSHAAGAGPLVEAGQYWPVSAGTPDRTVPHKRLRAVATRNPCYTELVANLTLSVEDDVLRQARIRALERGTTVNALVRAYLEAFVGPDEARHALDAIAEIAERSQASSGPGGRQWHRDDVYE